MKIFVDIGHPAHVHYLKNIIRILKSNGHSFVITARDKEVTFNLLESLGIEYYSRGKGAKGILNNFFYLVKTDWQLLQIAKKHQPDLFFSPASAHMAHVSKLMRKPYIGFDDTEHANLNRNLYLPFTDVLLTPQSFYKSLGKKQIRFKGYLELTYLHPKYYKPDSDIKRQLGISEKQKLAVLRFISWEAFHDRSQTGIPLEFKINLIRELSKFCKVIISSEGELPDLLKEFEFKFPPNKLHDLLSVSEIYIGEGATMASESAILGVPAIYVNPLSAGTLFEQEKRFGLLYQFKDYKGVLNKAVEIINLTNSKEIYSKKRQRLLDENIDVTSFFVWLIENYPQSIRTIKENPDYQSVFK
jgi:uncharacterized protein